MTFSFHVHLYMYVSAVVTCTQRVLDLCLSCSCLSREVDHEWNELVLVQSVHEVVLDIHTLTSSCGSDEQDCSAVLDHEVH